jgi:hypothetical protein
MHMKKIIFPLNDRAFYRTVSVSNLTRHVLIKADKGGSRPVFGFAKAGSLHRVAHLLKNKDYSLTEGEDPQQMLPLYVGITDRKSLVCVPGTILNREGLTEKHYTYYEGNMVPMTWAGAIAAAGNIKVICPRDMTVGDVVEAGLIRVCAQAGELMTLDPKVFAPFSFSASRQIEAFANDNDLCGHPDSAERWKDAFAWLAFLFTAARDQVKLA